MKALTYYAIRQLKNINMLHYIYVHHIYIYHFSFLVRNNFLFDRLIVIEQSKLLF